MKKIQVFVRAREVSSGSFIGIYGMQYKSVVKNTMKHELEESDLSRAELQLIIEAVSNCKEPCDITIYTLDKLVVKRGGELVSLHVNDLVEKLKETILEGNHEVDFVVHSQKDGKKIKRLFEEYKKMLDSIKLGGEQ